MTRLSFSEFVRESKDTVYFSFGRMNPPTIGHEKLLDKMSEMSGQYPYRMYLSHSHDNKKNPLLYEEKLKFARSFFPKHARAICENYDVRNFLEAASNLYNDGYKNIVAVVGDDRLSEFKERLTIYNGKEGRHGYYMFESIKVVSAGHRDDSAKGVEAISASMIREAVEKSDFMTFSQGLPKNVSDDRAKSLYNAVRVGLGLKEETTFRTHVQLDALSETREKYVKGELFSVGDDVVITATEEVAKLTVLGANYVIVETADGKRIRKWLNDVEKLF